MITHGGGLAATHVIHSLQHFVISVAFEIRFYSYGKRYFSLYLPIWVIIRSEINQLQDLFSPLDITLYEG